MAEVAKTISGTFAQKLAYEAVAFRRRPKPSPTALWSFIAIVAVAKVARYLAVVGAM
jgi:hypothetical protein